MTTRLNITTKEGVRNLIFGYASEQGNYRRTNEDVCMITPLHSLTIFGINDGHGGSRAAEFINQRLPEYIGDLYYAKHIDLSTALSHSLLSIDQEFIKSGYTDGSTSLVVIITADGQMVIGNIGDCEGVLGYTPIHPDDVIKSTRPLIRMESLCPLGPHNPRKNPFEARRVTQNGGSLTDGRVNCYVASGQVISLAVSRAIGDAPAKYDTSPLLATPDIYTYHLTGFEDFIVLASDGLWDVFNQQEIFFLVRDYLKNSLTPTDIAKKLIKSAYTRGSTDNVSVMVILFR